MLTQLRASSPDCEIVSTRIVNATTDEVYTAWSTPDYLKIWWGPAGFTNTFNTFDFRPGGRWSFVMHGPDKGNYHNECEFLITERPALIAWKRHSQPLFNVVAAFEEAATGKTKITFRMIFATPEECNKLKKFVTDKNEENFDRLEKVLLALQVEE